MMVKAVVLALVVCVVPAAPWMVGQSVAAAVPEYFDDEWVGFACLAATAPGGATTPTLLQINFDKLAGGGVSLAQADASFTRAIGSFGWLGQLTGASYQMTCTLSPSQAQGVVAGVTARQALTILGGTFPQHGFTAYLIVDSFLTVTPAYLGSNVAIRRSDAYRVTGVDALTYLGSHEEVEPPAP